MIRTGHFSIGGGCTRGRSPPWSFCGGCYENIKRRANHKGCLSYVRPRKPIYVERYAMMKRTGPTAVDPTVPWACPDPHFLKLYPHLAQGMCDLFFDDKKVRKPWKISIGFEGDGCSLCLTDKNTNCYAYTNARDLSEALRLCEAAVAAETIAWRKNTR